MNMDLKFYECTNSQIKLMHILPAYSAERGYISANATKEFRGNGKIEIKFFDTILTNLIRDKMKSNITVIVYCKTFSGVLTSWMFDENHTTTVFGYSLNYLLHKQLILPTAATKTDVSSYVKNTLAAMFNKGMFIWLNYNNSSAVGSTRNFEEITDPTPGDEWLQKILEYDDLGYDIEPDFTKGRFTLTLKKRKENSLLIAPGNLNFYDVVQDCDQSAAVRVGYYKDVTTGNWTKVTSATETATTIYDNYVVLSSDNAASAQEEINALYTRITVDGKTRDIAYGTDYDVGDILRVQIDGQVYTKTVKSIFLSYEGISNIENPTFEDYIKE